MREYVPNVKAKKNAGILPYFDVALMWLSAALCLGGADLYGYFLGLGLNGQFTQTRLLGFLFVYSLFFVLLVQAQGLYSNPWKRSFREELAGLAQSVASAAFLTAAALYFANADAVSFVLAITTVMIGWVAMAAWRRFLHSQSIPGLTEKRNVVIVGAGQLAMRLRRHLAENLELGFVVCGFIDRRNESRTGTGAGGGVQFLGKVADLPTVVRAHFIDEVFVCVPGDWRLVREVATYTKRLGVNLRVVPDVQPVEMEYMGEVPMMSLQSFTSPIAALIVKRLFDIVASAIGMLILSPVMLAIAVIVKLDSRGPVLYNSFRVGKKGQTFLCHKFRTMRVDADALKDSLRDQNQRNSVTFKISGDPRITRVGRILRKYSLDELPQLWNVLAGDLSLVGPRPHPLDDYSRYALEHRRRLEVKPGITGLWQVTARRDPSFDKNVALDMEYIQNWSLWLDCQILWKTLTVVVSGTGE